MLTMRAMSSVASAALVLASSACRMIETTREVGAKVDAKFPGDGPKVTLSNGRKLVVRFEDPDKQLAAYAPDNRSRAAAEIVAGVLPRTGRIDSVEIVIVKYGVGIGGAHASVEASENFSASELKATKLQ